jgi:hypothetical protein
LTVKVEYQFKSVFNPIQRLWNKFRKIYGSYRLYVKFQVIIETKQLSVKKVNPQREFKLKLIKSLSDVGWDTKRISNFLNNNKIKTFNGLRWTPKLVYMNRQKYLKRLKILKDYKIIHVKENLVIRSVKILRI